MNSYIFVLGTTSFALCQTEVVSVLDSLAISYNLMMVHLPLLAVKTPHMLNTHELINRLGGCSKISRVLGTLKYPVASEITPFIKKHENGRVTFGLSFYSPHSSALTELHTQIKEQLKQAAEKIRYVAPQSGQTLTSIVISKQHVSEYIVFYEADSQTWKIAKTVAVQDAEGWRRREFGRPHADPKSGMLPQKVARMMVNLAVGSDQRKQLEKLTLLDPFCGMGTILVEALLLGWHVVGSDLSSEVIMKTQKNLEWILRNYPQINQSSYQLITGNATHVSEEISTSTIDAIVTEPFMGRVIEKKDDKLWQKGKQLSESDAVDMMRGLEKLYIGAFRDWHSILNKAGRIVIAFPQLCMRSRFFSVKNPVDSCEKLGYTLTHGPYTYARPRAIVRRQIYVFKKL